MKTTTLGRKTAAEIKKVAKRLIIRAREDYLFDDGDGGALSTGGRQLYPEPKHLLCFLWHFKYLIASPSRFDGLVAYTCGYPKPIVTARGFGQSVEANIAVRAIAEEFIALKFE